MTVYELFAWPMKQLDKRSSKLVTIKSEQTVEKSIKRFKEKHNLEPTGFCDSGEFVYPLTLLKLKPPPGCYFLGYERHEEST